MDANSSIVYTKAEKNYADILKNVKNLNKKARFNTSNYDLDRMLPKVKSN